ncbi:unnamed protein product [Choristocarpus tenellus]
MHLHPLLAQQPLAGPLLGNDLLFAVEEKKNNLWCTSRFERHCHFPLSQPSLFAGWSPVCRSAWVCSVGRRQASPWSCGTLEQSMGSDFNGISGVMGGSGAEEMRRGEGEDGRREAQVGEGPRTHKDLTLVFCRREGKEGKKEILLGKKKRGFGEGKWNGFGGKVEAGETIVEASCRELLEESHLTAHQENLSKRGLLTFHVPSYPTVMVSRHRWYNKRENAQLSTTAIPYPPKHRIDTMVKAFV